jgi:hypothetical protein
MKVGRPTTSNVRIWCSVPISALVMLETICRENHLVWHSGRPMKDCLYLGKAIALLTNAERERRGAPEAERLAGEISQIRQSRATALPDHPLR